MSHIVKILIVNTISHLLAVVLHHFVEDDDMRKKLTR